MRVLESEGFKVTYLPVQKNGLIDLKVRNLTEDFILNKNV
jgi:cysteine sulfinate desulfinase/cysteine desulfurase-like protein